MSVHPIIKRGASTDHLLMAAGSVADEAADHAAALDHDLAFPLADIEHLHHSGLLIAPFPRSFGGIGLAIGAQAPRLLLPILRRMGGGNLSLGRLYEGHVNAVGLVVRYGSPDQVGVFAAEARGGGLFGVWAADDVDGLGIVQSGTERSLKGRKVLCSGASFIERPIVTARDEAGRLFMAMPRLRRGERADLSGWTPAGMRASATGTVDLGGIHLNDDEIIGGEDDYHRQPTFSAGAWRFAAVQLGGMEALLDRLRDHFKRTKRGGDPHQSARLGEAAIAVETARLWVERAAVVAEAKSIEPDAAAAYVNLARIAVERGALALIEIVHRSVGLASFMRPNPIERISRDLATYLRQPGPDRALTSAAAWILEREEGPQSLWPET
jgi:alkylation response protein AidB-like acyl-CoA dehydrogenase